MTSLAPACCSFCAMAQAMLRLLATPKTTAVRPVRSIIEWLPVGIIAFEPSAVSRQQEQNLGLGFLASGLCTNLQIQTKMEVPVVGWFPPPPPYPTL